MYSQIYMTTMEEDMFKLVKEEGNNIMVEVEGTIDKGDYEKFFPIIENLVKKYGKLNTLSSSIITGYP